MLKLAQKAVAAALLAALPFTAQAADKSVKVTSIVEHPALDATRDGIRDELEAQGFKAGEGLRWEYQSAQGDTGTAAQIARKFVGDRADVIVAIATPSAQAAVAAARGSIPVVFSAVTDPVAARLVKSWEEPGGNVTGVSDALPLERHLDLAQEILPDLKRLGVLFNPGEVNSVSTVASLKEAAGARGIQVVEGSAPDTNSVLGAARSLVGRVDAIYIPTDNTVVSALEAVVKVGQDSKLPVLAADTASVPRGAIAAVGFDYYDVGRQTGKIVAEILRGKPAGEIPVQGIETVTLSVNPASAERMGVTLPEAVLSRAEVVQ
ncbi:ABC transporter substrate-binding protein [Telmatospirillum sp. J64-1]|uniref:ABC transporter substrate-binding protein n=1 Tax=Telmatospirillum sp. J64-1 TaxID=2502183 RepID=UPI00115F0C32|nr:ABC transporter substrate-binding protein [Telmatospirillum sp. J64-1]